MKKLIPTVFMIALYCTQSNASRWEAEGQYVGFRYYGTQSTQTSDFHGDNAMLGVIPSAPQRGVDNGGMYSLISGIYFPNIIAPGIITPRAEIEIMYLPLNSLIDLPTGLNHKSNNNFTTKSYSQT